MRRATCFVFLAGFLLIASEGHAQLAADVVRPDQPVSGRLDESDPQTANGRRFHTYRLSADSGARYSVSLTSTEFDPLVKIGTTIGGVTDYVAEDDDSGVGTNALANFRAMTSGPYIIVVTTAASGTGRFTLDVKETRESAPVVRRTAIGETVSGMFTRETATWEQTRAPYELFTFQARRGQFVRLAVRGDSINTSIAIGHLQGTRFLPLSSGRSTNGSSILTLSKTLAPAQYLTPPEDGEYAAIVLAPAGTTGRYTLKLSQMQSLPDTSGPRVLAPGSESRGFLAGDSPNPHRLGSIYQDWTLSAKEGDRLAVTLRSTEFDPFLILGRLSSTGSLFGLDTSDDAAGLGEDSRIVFSAPATGKYVLRVKGGGAGGAYVIRVDRVEAVKRTLRRQSAVIGQELRGSLGDSDATLPDGSPYQEWVIHGTAGDRLTITMRSSDFDTFLSVGQYDGEKYTEWSSNDDGPEDSAKSHQSRVVAVIQKTGDYVARANGMSPAAKGAYTLTVERSRVPVPGTDSKGR